MGANTAPRSNRERLSRRERCCGGRERVGFFYCSLAHASESGQAGDLGRRLETVGRAVRIVELYGVLRFIVDVDNGRDYASNTGNDPNITSSILTWASGEGFSEVMRELDSSLEYRSAREFRERYLLGALKSIGGMFGGS
jgi:hypothetical protein